MALNLKENKYIIVELIPTKINNGIIVQLSALKLDGIMLLDRFDYRVDDDLVPFPDLLNMISYDKDQFKYTNSPNKIMKEFKKWAKNLPILYINNAYTENYLKSMKNNLVPVLDYFDMAYSDDCIDKIISKYNLQESNYIVDLLYEALIREID